MSEQNDTATITLLNLLGTFDDMELMGLNNEITMNPEWDYEAISHIPGIAKNAVFKTYWTTSAHQADFFESVQIEVKERFGL